ncbi:MAG: hypothetical protein K0S34_1026 [Bacillales bacterium]|jgi:hypothetical protein|nr:hypothetical protein [Bacillales bacterium]
MKVIQIFFALFPIPFLFHFYEYNSRHERQDTFLLLMFLLLIIIVGIQFRNINLSLFLGINIIMTLISLILGYFFIPNDGIWFKPFGRNGAIIFISAIYILGQLIIRSFSKTFSSYK